jgi:hypothetical protein
LVSAGGGIFLRSSAGAVGREKDGILFFPLTFILLSDSFPSNPEKVDLPNRLPVYAARLATNGKTLFRRFRFRF